MSVNYEVTTDLLEYAIGGVEQFDGMLNRSAAVSCAALFTLLDREHSWTNKAFLEIGVYKGKFFSLAEYATRGTNCTLIGVDPFVLPEQSLEEVITKLKTVGAELNRIVMHKGISREEGVITGLVENRPVLAIHVDGSHEEPTVYEDILMADRLVSDEGIVIADDFWNRKALGVASALFRILIDGRSNLMPFMLCNTKLVLCKTARRSFYLEAALEMIKQNEKIHLFREFIEAHRTKPHWHCFQQSPCVSMT